MKKWKCPKCAREDSTAEYIYLIFCPSCQTALEEINKKVKNDES